VRAARCRGERFVCAASVANEEIAAECGELHRLPAIHDNDFPSAFLSLVKERAVCRLFCPVSTVYAFMAKFVSVHRLDIKLLGPSPVARQIEQHRQLMDRARRLLPLMELCADGAAGLSLLELAGVLRQSSLIYGESNDDKLAAMMGIFARAPEGDVVEIGSLMGRSAFVLLYLAWRFRIGAVLTIDPWEAAECIQRDSPDSLQTVTEEWDYEMLSEGFMVNMIPFRADDHAHLRLPSEKAFEVYAEGYASFSSRYGHVAYSRKIAVIHIDGNHDYDRVRTDCVLWLGKMLPGGWLILDDYIWSHGDGPYRVGNELLLEQPERIECSFVCGKALFIKLRY
jgi:hypothetical protein